MKKYITIGFFLNLIVGYAQITPTPVAPGFATKSADIQVTSSGIWHAEESIAIDKSNPSSIIISAMDGTTVVNGGGPYSNQGIWISSDGGNTWSGNDQLPNSDVSQGDPCVVFDAQHQGFVVGLGMRLSDQFVSIDLETTSNGGSSWNSQVESVSTEDDVDKPMSAAIDMSSSSPYNNYFYTAWTNFDVNNDGSNNWAVQFNRSTDHGITFGSPITLKSGAGFGANVQTGPDGEVYVCWADGTNTDKYIAFASDITHGGTTFTVNDIFTETGANEVSGLSAFNNTRVNDFPSMAVDKSCGPHHGRIYIAYTNGFSTGQNVVKVSYSDDNGTTWSTGIIVSNATSTYGQDFSQSWFPAIAVDDITGMVNVAYFAMLGVPTILYETMPYVSYSSDGGASWQMLAASDAGHVTSQIDGAFAGDYIGICSFNGNTYTTWHDNRTGTWQVYVSKISYNMPYTYSSLTDLNVNAGDLLVNGVTASAINFKAKNDIVSPSDAMSIIIGGIETYTAGHQITLEPGFEARATYYTGTGITIPFLAQIKESDCQNPGVQSRSDQVPSTEKAKLSPPRFDSISGYPNPTNGKINLVCKDSIFDGSVTLQIKNIRGQTLRFMSVQSDSNGTYWYNFDATSLQPGVYFFTFISGQKTRTSRFVKIN